MKRFFPRLSLLLLFLICIGSSHAQWYSYDAFEKKELTRSQMLAVAVQQASVATRAKGLTSFSRLIDANITEFATAVKDQKKNLIRDLVSLEAQIKAQQLLINAAAPGAKAALEAQLEKIKKDSTYLASDRPLDSLIRLRQQARYLKSRYQNFSLFPVKSSSAAEAYFENKDTLTLVNSDSSGVFKFEHAYLNYLTNTKTLAAYTEPMSDFIGPVRLSVGLMLVAPAKKDENQTQDKFDKQQFADKFKSGGGNLSLNASFPLLHIWVSKYLDIKSFYSPRLSLDVPDDDNSSVKVPLHAQWLAIDNQIKIVTVERKLSILLCHRFARVSGNSSFYDQLGYTGDERKTFNFTTWTAGFIAKEKLAIYYTWYAGSSSVISRIGNNGSITANIQLD